MLSKGFKSAILENGQAVEDQILSYTLKNKGFQIVLGLDVCTEEKLFQLGELMSNWVPSRSQLCRDWQCPTQLMNDLLIEPFSMNFWNLFSLILQVGVA